MFERREIQLNLCSLLVTSVFMLLTALYVPLSIKGYINISTHCSEFRLDDPYISWPHHREQVKHTKELAVFGAVTLLLLLLYSWCRPSSVNQIVLNISDKMWYIFDIRLFRVLYIGYYILLGYLMILVALGFVKHSAGELRPCFLDLCAPNMTLVEELTRNDSTRTLFNRDICSNQDIDYFCMSFFSGHTVSAFYAAAIGLILLQNMDTAAKQRYFSVRFLAQILLISSAVWVGMTRLQDHYHHVIDIVTAMVVGVAVAMFMLISPLKMLHEEEFGEKCGELGPILSHDKVYK